MKKLRDFNSSTKDQKEIYEKLEYLNARFREIPFVILTAEAHHTLEVFEEYLLNSINERDSLSLSSFAPSKNSLIHEKNSGVLKKNEESEDDEIEDELEIHEEEEEDDDVDEEDDNDINIAEMNFKNNKTIAQKNQENSMKSG
jgi:DNA primase large subunit